MKDVVEERGKICISGVLLPSTGNTPTNMHGGKNKR